VFRIQEFRIHALRMPSIILLLLLVLLVLSAPVALFARSEPEVRRFTFQYEAVVGPVVKGTGPVEVFVPLAVQSDQQHLVSEKIDASIPGEIDTEDVYGNRYWRGRVEVSDGEPIAIRITTTVERRVSRRAPPTHSRALTDAERGDLALFLGENSRVVVDHPILEPIRAEVRQKASSDDPAIVSRAIYDWVVDNVEYKKVGTGWGNGDTFWACSERYGNCTDFHALFISLARSEGIPARFEIGFPVPEDRPSGEIGGYHCWVEFYLPDNGWFPIDASEAFKHPEKREHFYGAHPGDRIHFTTGRDLQIGGAGPLNYFVYPHIEVAGRIYAGPLERSFSYEAL
jgi:transglutaminase-like putative cysteine protease